MQYPDRSKRYTLQPLADPLTPTWLLWKAFSHAAVTAQKLFIHTFPPLPIARYSFMHLSELGRCWANGKALARKKHQRVRHSTAEIPCLTSGVLIWRVVADLTMCRFSAEGTPFSVDSLGVVRMLNRAFCHSWTQVANTKTQVIIVVRTSIALTSPKTQAQNRTKPESSTLDKKRGQARVIMRKWKCDFLNIYLKIVTGWRQTLRWF